MQTAGSAHGYSVHQEKWKWAGVMADNTFLGGQPLSQA